MPARADRDFDLEKYDRLKDRAATLRLTLPSLGSPLTGTDLSEGLGREPGEWIKPIKQRLSDLLLEGILAPDDKSAAWHYVRSYLGARVS